MSVLHSPESEFAKESVKWEAQHTSMGPGLRPYVKRDFPMMLHKAGRGSAGPPLIVETEIVDDDRQVSLKRHEGYYPTPLEAIAALEAQEREFATLAAEREHDVKHKLSSAAVAEVRAEEATQLGHLPVMPKASERRSKE